MSHASQFAFALAVTVVGVCSACSSSSTNGAAPAPAASGNGPFTVLITGSLSTDEANSKALHENVVAANKAQAVSAGDLGHDAFLVKDGLDPAKPQFLSIDRWQTVDGYDTFAASPNVVDFVAKFYASSPDVSVWQPRQGWTTWGSPTDEAPSAGGYVITLRGHHAGDDATALATHNKIVAGIPAPGAVGLGNTAHMLFANPNDSTELLIIEVWTNEAAQEGAYMQLGPQIAMLWDGMPTITRWQTTDWTRW